MITSRDFPKIRYKDPKRYLSRKEVPMELIFGADTEAYTDGVPFMFCTSEGHTYDPSDLPWPLFDDYPGANFMLYNIKYDSGAILYHLSKDDLHTLWEFGKLKTTFIDTEVIYKYIPHKLLRITANKITISFWDVAQFFHSSLKVAAEKYLDEDEQKRYIRTKRFSRKYVARFHRSITRYCIQDAFVTKRLGQYFIKKLSQFHIVPSSIYSPASISFTFFKERTQIETSWRVYNDHPECLQYAIDAYEGGKFEMTARGSFDAHEYDITSAYPYEISNLFSLKEASFFKSRSYQKSAVYGFLRCRIDNTPAKHIPCGMMINGVKVYPSGIFYLTITKQEYDYLTDTLDLDVDIIDAWWITVPKKSRPYQGVINYLFNIKDQYKGKDSMLYSLTKIAMNGFYGKTVQAIKTPYDTIEVGAGWNPIHGAVITANTRIKVSRLQNLLNDRCLAVHTDSVFTLDPLPDSYLGTGLGEFEHVVSGRAILIACGMYQIKDTCAFKGFRPRDGDTWESMLTRNRYRTAINDRVLRVESWIEAMAKNHEKSRVNVFEKVQKKIDLNCDTKRNWSQGPWKAGRFLTDQEFSTHKIVVQNSMPKNWT